MASMSNSSIDTIVQCLTKAVEAARGLDSSRSQNLCFALNIANSEAGRVAKSMKKTSAAAKKPVQQQAKQPEKAAKPAKSTKSVKPAARVIVAPKQPKAPVQGRRRNQTLNGAVAH
jgi:hypothetical protein